MLLSLLSSDFARWLDVLVFFLLTPPSRSRSQFAPVFFRFLQTCTCPFREDERVPPPLDVPPPPLGYETLAALSMNEPNFCRVLSLFYRVPPRNFSLFRRFRFPPFLALLFLLEVKEAYPSLLLVFFLKFRRLSLIFPSLPRPE